METNLRKIEELSRQREDENWRFRCFLKSSDLSAARIDALVQRLCREVTAEIDCTSCGNCCRVMQPVLTTADIKRLAAHLGMTVARFRADHTKTGDEDRTSIVFNAMPCPFLRDNRCSVYDHRPRDCRSYPHLLKKDFVSRLSQAYANCGVCPIVFNVYEGLKRELWRPGSGECSSDDDFLTESIFDFDDCDEDLEAELWGDDLAVCNGCDCMLPVGDLGLCGDCAEKLDRDLIRKRDWNYSVAAYGLDGGQREKLRRQVIAVHGAAHELLGSTGRKMGTHGKRGKKRKKGRV